MYISVTVTHVGGGAGLVRTSQALGLFTPFSPFFLPFFPSSAPSLPSLPPSQAAERGHLSVAQLLISSHPEVVVVRDKRGRVAREVVARWSDRWEEVLAEEEKR